MLIERQYIWEPTPLVSEVKGVIDQLSGRKAPGKDKIHLEPFKTTIAEEGIKWLIIL